MSLPNWFTVLQWSSPRQIEELRDDRTLIPNKTGIYIFTNFSGALEACTGVLYVGKAKSLHKRIQSYLTDPSELLVLSPRSGNVSSSLKHAGKAQLLVEVQQRMRMLGHTATGIYVRWHCIAAPTVLENQLIKLLQPAFNTQGK